MHLSELGQTSQQQQVFAQRALKKFQEGVETDSKAEFPWVPVLVFGAGFVLYSLFSGGKKQAV